MPFVDLLEGHAAGARQFSGGIDAGLSRYFIGHYNPPGNFFCEFAIKDKLVRLPDPHPPKTGARRRRFVRTQ